MHILKLLIIILYLNIFQTVYAHPLIGEPQNQQWIAIYGYDSVAYHTDNKAVKGSETFSYEYLDSTWLFASKVNLELFSQSPERYAPQFNGHCANGLSDAHKVNGDPEIFKIIDDKLYFFYSKWGRTQWAFNQKEQIELANHYWELFKND
ncbi:YHS domain-containing (seleno)protein [Marinicellulosiphila megalodicopiae]|uniref:YHS domain-containing (seleno)protein n=1 Tax=Marinicellulosiphila megalodicopiae TaxID=2724896 RepID=UPI003BB1FA07